MLAIDRNPLQTVFGQNEPTQDFLRVANIFEPTEREVECGVLPDAPRSGAGPQVRHRLALGAGFDPSHECAPPAARFKPPGRFFSAPSFLWNGQAADLAGD